MTSHSRVYRVAFVALLFLLPAAARAATLSISPSNNSITNGSTFTERVVVSSSDQPLNAISGTLSFPPNLLHVVSVSQANSILSLWVAQPTFSNTDGTISFSGIVPNPGYQGSGGQVFSIQFLAEQTGTATLSLSSDSQVLANDGNGTDILTGSPSGTVTIETAPSQTPTPVSPVPAASGTISLVANITSSTHPDQTQWYALSHASFDWTNAQGVTAVRLGYDQDPAGPATVLYADPISHKEIDLADGVWYFHVQEKGSSGWGPVSTYTVQIDTVPPLPFTITFLSGTTTAQYGTTIPLQFTASDELSGIEYYEISVDGKQTRINADDGSRPYALPAQPSGDHTLLIQAYDKAGNVTNAGGKFSVTTGTSSSSIFTFGWLALNYISLGLIALAILGTLLFAAWYIHVHFSAYRRHLNHQLTTTHSHIHKEFDSLKDAITEEILSLEQAKTQRDLTHEEQRLISRFKSLLEETEKAIEKDIEEIPS